MKKKSEVFAWLYRAFYVLIAYEFFYIRIYRAHILGESGLRRDTISHIIVFVAVGLFVFLYFYLIKKWNIKYICPRCGKPTKARHIRISLSNGILTKQKCKNCHNEWYPDMID